MKSVEHLLPIQRAQLMSYLKLSGCKLGLLINFNVTLLKHGIVRIVNGLDEGNSTSPTPRSSRSTPSHRVASGPRSQRSQR